MREPARWQGRPGEAAVPGELGAQDDHGDGVDRAAEVRLPDHYPYIGLVLGQQPIAWERCDGERLIMRTGSWLTQHIRNSPSRPRALNTEVVVP